MAAADDPLLPLHEVATRAGCSAARVRLWIETGELVGEQVDGAWMVRASVLDAAPYSAGIPVRLALGRARMNAVHRALEGRPPPPPAEPEPEAGPWPALPAAQLTALARGLAALRTPRAGFDGGDEAAIQWRLRVGGGDRAALGRAFAEPWPEAIDVWCRDDDDGALCLELRLAERAYAEAELRAVLDEATARARAAGATIAPSSSPADAATRSAALAALLDELDELETLHLDLELEAPRDRATLEPLLLALGLEPWETGTFAVLAGDEGAGADAILQLAMDDDLTIGASVQLVRTARPHDVVAAAHDLLEALRAQLGGTIARSRADTTAQVDRVVQALAAHGLVAGGNALML